MKVIIASHVSALELIPMTQRFNPALIARIESAKILAEPLRDEHALMLDISITPTASIRHTMVEYADAHLDPAHLEAAHLEAERDSYRGYTVVEFDDTLYCPIIDRNSFTVDEWEQPDEDYLPGETYYREELVLCPKFPQNSDSECR